MIVNDCTVFITPDEYMMCHCLTVMVGGLDYVLLPSDMSVGQNCNKVKQTRFCTVWVR